jgi:hypothetical protein
MNNKSSVAVRNDQITSLNLMLVKFLKSSFKGLVRRSRFESFFAQKSSRTIATQRFKCPSVAYPDKHAMLIDSQPSSTIALISGA